MHLLRVIVKDVEPGWEGRVLAGNVDHAARATVSQALRWKKADLLYALCGAIGKEKRTAMKDESRNVVAVPLPHRRGRSPLPHRRISQSY